MKNNKFKIITTLLLDKGVKILSTLIITSYFAKNLSLEDFGHLNFALLLYTIITAYLQPAYRNLFNKYSNEKYGDEYLVCLAVQFAILILINIITVYIYVYINIEKSWIPFYLILVTQSLFAIFSINKYLLEFNLEFKKIAIYENLVLIIATIAKILIVKFKLDLTILGLVFFIEQFIIGFGLYLFWRLSRENDKIKIPSIERKNFLSVLKLSYPVILTGLIGVLYSKVDSILIGTHMNKDNFATYTAAVKIVELGTILPSVISISSIPILSRLFTLNKKQFRNEMIKNCAIAMYASVFFIILFNVFGDYIIKIIFGDKFLSGKIVLQILSYSLITTAIGFFWSAWMILCEKTLTLLSINIVCIALNATITYSIINYVNIDGVALANTIVLMGGAIVGFYSYRSTYFIKIIALAILCPVKSGCRFVLRKGV